MAAWLGIRRMIIVPRIYTKSMYPLSLFGNNSMCHFKSSNESVDKTVTSDKTSRKQDPSHSIEAYTDNVIENFETQSTWDNLESSNFTSFADIYGDSHENKNSIESSDIQVIPVSDVLKDMLVEKSLHANKMAKKSSHHSLMSKDENDNFGKYISENKDQEGKWFKKQSANTQVKKENVSNMKTIKFYTKYPTTGKKLKKIILLDKTKSLSKHSKVNSIKHKSKYSQKEVLVSETFSEKSPQNLPSRNIYNILEQKSTSSEDIPHQNTSVAAEEASSQSNSIVRKNSLGIQMLSPSLYHQLFGIIAPKPDEEQEQDFLRSKRHLEDQNLWGLQPSFMPDVDFHLPALEGSSLKEHFHSIAENQCAPYKMLLEKLISSDIPSIPKAWQYTPGWTRYNDDGTYEPVSHPTCQALVFDVEVCVKEGNHPILATAVSDKYWYSWCSNHLVSDCNMKEIDFEDLIPLESSFTSDNEVDETSQVPRVVVGHNVSYDRLRVREQYSLKDTALKFVDTMSLHIAVSGLVSEQRALIMKNKSSEYKVWQPWMSVGCQNNLNDVYKFYCKVKDGLKKDTRNIFVKGTLQDIRNDFDDLTDYCANDVKATLKVLQNLLPLFFKRFPHPVTFSGMLEMGSTFLPVTQNWLKYISASEAKYNDLECLLNEELVKQAQDALTLMEDEKYKKDPWLWNLDWSIPKGRVKTLPGYPNWYRKLCAQTGEREGTPEPENMSTSLQIVPKLLRLRWDGFPLHHDRKYGWGYLKPLYEKVSSIPSNSSTAQSQNGPEDSNQDEVIFPIEALYEICSGKGVSLDEFIEDKRNQRLESPETEEDWQLLLLGDDQLDNATERKKFNTIVEADAPERSYDIGIPGVCFVPLPHKDGPGNRVGNPLAKDFLNKIEDNTLSSHHGDLAKVVLETNKMISYWKNNRDRILSQMVIWNTQKDSQTMSSKSYDEANSTTGIILPSVVSAGTITRRAVERTWMTASNAYTDRIGSELKSLIEAPSGYKFVGADVDSQELWIAAVLGDAYFASEHGATAMGWMTLQGKKSDGSDMHSRTASMAGISRDHAKVINYGRIYGAGMKFIQRLLKQFNHDLSDEDAENRAKSLFEATKGKKGWLLNEKGIELTLAIDYPYTGEALSRKEINALVRTAAKNGVDTSFADIANKSPIWVGGSESHMFNCLEAIARSDKPKTPVLGAHITRALEPEFVDDNFMTSRVNWVVQSSAVDYLHLMLVSMKWLFKKYDISGRFCISIHDEVRYMVAEEDCYRAALALQITNLLTRSLFATRLGFRDLPLSVAFFSSVDIDQVLRKEPTHDCITPSNPLGLEKGYGIPPGESLDIEKILHLTKGKLEKSDKE